MAIGDRILASVLGCVDHDALLVHILNNGSAGALLVALDARIVFANDAFCGMLGIAKADLLEGSLDDLVHFEDREAGRQDRDIIVWETAAVRDFERRFTGRDGRTVWGKGSVSLLRGKEGEPQLLAYQLMDTTALKEMTLEKERLHATLRSIADAVICTDTQSRVTFMNPLAERLTGWAVGEAAGRSMREIFNLIDERSGRPPVNPIEKCMAESRPLTVEAG